MTDKLIVTNLAALRRKYGAGGLAAVRSALMALIAADRARGLATQLVDLANAAAMARLGAPAVRAADDSAQNKRAIDAAFQKLKPAYLMLLGARDVIPHQNLVNPVLRDDPSDDPIAWSDLPYACEAPYSRDVADFIDPARVVARLPDLTGARRPDHLLRLLKVAAAWRGRPRAEYDPPFALSARSWQRSTATSLRKVFGNAKALRTAPPTTGARARRQLAALSHFINCHGGEADPQFYGQHYAQQPVALTSAQTRGRLRAGTVASIECCYGAELYDSVGENLDIPICQSYLAQGAYGYFGSTTVAYGPASGNGSADLITQAFLREVRAGRSIGAAALKARQDYATSVHELDPIDLKTLAQFCLYGDPSIHPVRIDAAAGTRALQPPAARAQRRAQAREAATRIRLTTPIAALADLKASIAPATRQELLAIAQEAGLKAAPEFVTYMVQQPNGALERALGDVAERYHLAIRPRPGRQAVDIGGRIAIVARAAGERLLGYRIYQQK